MLQLVLAAPRSGSGKTTAACALLAALTARGADPCAFKSGPDYIDPMFHRAVLGVESHNLDLFFSTPDTVRTLYARHAAGHGAAIVEGAMGYYDGLGGVTDTASAWQLADTLGLPALLVVRPKGASLTLAAELRGLTAFRTPHRIAGILLNDCTENLYSLLKPMLEKETGLPVVGYLPPLPEAAIESRHLGLRTAAEIDDLQQKIKLLADAAQKNMDWALLYTLFDRPATAATPRPKPVPRVRIAVAKDAAFCFAYAETLEALEENGAELCFFSPLTDAALPPDIGGLYLPGGYPELCAAQLAANAPMRAAVRAAVENGLPTVAECGGFLYLGHTLEDADGTPHPMVGVLPGQGFKVGRLVRFGYATLSPLKEGGVMEGVTVKGHEFHYWDSDLCGEDWKAVKSSGAEYRC
ncbi:cobyrinate a,c-diamide synthase, partial [Gemmiger sp.]